MACDGLACGPGLSPGHHLPTAPVAALAGVSDQPPCFGFLFLPSLQEQGSAVQAAVWPRALLWHGCGWAAEGEAGARVCVMCGGSCPRAWCIDGQCLCSTWPGALQFLLVQPVGHVASNLLEAGQPGFFSL